MKCLSAFALVLAFSSTPAVAQTVRYDCSLSQSVALFFFGDRLESSTSLSPANDSPYRKFVIEVASDGNITMGAIGRSLNLAGSLVSKTTAAGQIAWNSRELAMCPLIDAECLSNGMFQQNEDKSHSVLIQTIAAANDGVLRGAGLASLTLTYDCDQIT